MLRGRRCNVVARCGLRRQLRFWRWDVDGPDRRGKRGLRSLHVQRLLNRDAGKRRLVAGLCLPRRLDGFLVLLVRLELLLAVGFGLGRSRRDSHGVENDVLLADGALAHVVLAAHEVVDHVLSALGIELGQVAGDGVQKIIGFDAPRKWGAYHTSHELCDIGRVRTPALREDDLRSRAVPSVGDGLLGEEHADARGVLNELGFDIGNKVFSRRDVLMLAEDVGERHRLEKAGDQARDLVAHLSQGRVAHVVRRLDEQQRVDGALALTGTVLAPFAASQGIALARHSEVLVLDRVVLLWHAQLDDVLEQT